MTDGGEQKREEKRDMDFVGFLSEMMDAVRTYYFLLHVCFWLSCFLLPSALKSEISCVTLKAAFFLSVTFTLSADMGLLPSKWDLTIVFLWKKLHAFLVAMTPGGRTALTRVKHKWCLWTDSRLQRRSVKEVLSPVLKVTLSQWRKASTLETKPIIYFFPPVEVVFKIWELFILESVFFSCIFMHTPKCQLILEANISIRGRRRVYEAIILSQC